MTPLPGLPSDITLEYFARTIGILWSRFDQSEKTEGHYRALWEGVRTVSLMATVACNRPNGSYSNVCCSDDLTRVDNLIRDSIIIDPYKERYR